jgi:hypothetical protein
MIEARHRRVEAIGVGLLVVFGLFFLAWAWWGIHRNPGESWLYGGLGVANLVAALGCSLLWRRGARSAPPEAGPSSPVADAAADCDDPRGLYRRR